MIERNFIVEVQTACDIKTENCFSVEDDLSYGQNPYKKLTLTARYVPVCLEEHTCENFSCPEIISEGNICEITYCSDDTIDEGEECVGPNPEDDYIK